MTTEAAYGTHRGPFGAQDLADLARAQGGVVGGNLGATSPRKNHECVHGAPRCPIGVQCLRNKCVVVCNTNSQQKVNKSSLDPPLVSLSSSRTSGTTGTGSLVAMALVISVGGELRNPTKSYFKRIQKALLLRDPPQSRAPQGPPNTG